MRCAASVSGGSSASGRGRRPRRSGRRSSRAPRASRRSARARRAPRTSPRASSGSDTMCSRWTPRRVARDRVVVDGQVVDEHRHGLGAYSATSARRARPCRPGCTSTRWSMPNAASCSIRGWRHSSCRLVRTTMSRPARPAAAAPRRRAAPASGAPSRPGRSRRAAPTSPRGSDAARRRGGVIAVVEVAPRRASKSIACASSSQVRKCRTMCSSTSSQSVISSGLMRHPPARGARATSASGLTPSSSAQASRSGSCALEEAERRRQHRRLADPRAQVVGVEPGDVEQPLRAVRLGQRPGERLQRQGVRVRCGIVCIGACASPNRSAMTEGSCGAAWQRRCSLSRTTNSI